MLVAGGGILPAPAAYCFSLPITRAKRAQLAAHEVAFKSVKLREHKAGDALQLATWVRRSPTEIINLIQSELDLTVQADPEIVEVGIVDHDAELTVIIEL